MRNEKITPLYERLSRDDELQGESNSISCLLYTSSEIISKTEKAAFSELINQSTGMEKDELVVYYRLAILVESILIQYRK